MSADPCNCDQAKALQSELDASANAISALVEQVQYLEERPSDLRAAAYGVLAWIDRSASVGREAAQRLERALAVGAREAEPEVVATEPEPPECTCYYHAPELHSADGCRMFGCKCKWDGVLRT